MKLKFSILTLLLTVAPLWADAVKIVGSPKVESFGYAELSLIGAKPALWQVLPDPVQLSKDSARVLRFGGVPGTVYKVSAIYGTVDKTTGEIDFQVANFEVIFGTSPVPPLPPIPPVPPVPPEPNPPVPPVPTPTGPFRALVVYESSVPLSRGQTAVLYSTKVRAYLNEKCVKEDGQPAWRVWDKDVDTAKESATWQDVWKTDGIKTEPLPKVILFRGKKGEAFPLPDSEDAFLTLLKSFGG